MWLVVGPPCHRQSRHGCKNLSIHVPFLECHNGISHPLLLKVVLRGTGNSNRTQGPPGLKSVQFLTGSEHNITRKSWGDFVIFDRHPLKLKSKWIRFLWSKIKVTVTHLSSTTSGTLWGDFFKFGTVVHSMNWVWCSKVKVTDLKSFLVPQEPPVIADGDLQPLVVSLLLQSKK